MVHEVDARGFLCPVPAVKARTALRGLTPGDTLVVLATDREAPIDIGAIAADHGFTLTVHDEPGGGWRLELAPRPA